MGSESDSLWNIVNDVQMWISVKTQIGLSQGFKIALQLEL